MTFSLRHIPDLYSTKKSIVEILPLYTTDSKIIIVDEMEDYYGNKMTRCKLTWNPRELEGTSCDVQ